ncbi:MAG: hypothetical protein QNK11_05205 [Legionella sp.]|nr:hypothetical protein [Legionella sp.]
MRKQPKLTVQDLVSNWMVNSRDELKEAVQDAVEAYCLEKRKGKRHNVERDIGIAEKLNAEVQKGNFQALLDHVQGREKALGPSQGKNSLMDFMSEAVLDEVFEKYETDANFQAIASKMTPQEILKPGLINLKSGEIKAGIKELKEELDGLNNTSENKSSSTVKK